VILPDRKAIRVVERAVATADDVDGDVGVRRDNGHIRVAWTCGGTREFSPEDLTEAIGHIEALQEHPDVWFEGTDSNGHDFMARVVDGELYAGDSPTENDHVPWKALRKALTKAAG
jgi:hypothetical protein